MIFAKDMAKMTAFYRDGIGLALRPERSYADWSEFDAGGVTFALHRIPAHIADTLTIETPPVARAETPIKLFFITEDIAAARVRLMALGGVMDDIARDDGELRCGGVDPEGNVFTISEAR